MTQSRSALREMHTQTRTDDGAWRWTAFYPITDDEHYIELDWQAASAEVAVIGYLTLWIDGVEQGSLTGLDNDTRRMERVALGAVTGIDTNTRGTYYFDAFESHIASYIRP